MRSKNAFDGGLKRVPKGLLFGPQTNPGFHTGEVVVKDVQLLIALRDCGGQGKGGKGNGGGGKRHKKDAFHGDTFVSVGGKGLRFQRNAGRYAPVPRMSFQSKRKPDLSDFVLRGRLRLPLCSLGRHHDHSLEREAHLTLDAKMAHGTPVWRPQCFRASHSQ
jgi:hypothetical protein